MNHRDDKELEQITNELELILRSTGTFNEDNAEELERLSTSGDIELEEECQDLIRVNDEIFNTTHF